MKKFDIVTDRGSALAPRFEHATVHDVMRHGVISCGPEASLRDVSRIMASYHVHAVVVAVRDDVWGIVSASNVLRAAGTPDERLSAGDIAVTDVVTVRSEAALADAAQLMREHEIDHIVVSDHGQPVGVVSTLDIAGTLAWGEA